MPRTSRGMTAEERPPAAIIPCTLCVQCRRCTRKAFFSSVSAEARMPDEAVQKRFVCSHCGSRSAKIFRASDDRDAQRWMADR